MNRINNISELKDELEKVLLTANKAIENGRICAIERDIALERLRNVYQAFLDIDFEADSMIDVVSAYLSGQEEADKTDTSFDEEKIISDIPQSAMEESVEVKTTREITLADNRSGDETGIVVEENIQTTVKELLEESFVVQPAIDREIIESLYGDSELCQTKKPEIDEMEPGSRNNTPEDEDAAVEKRVHASTVLNETIGEAAPRDFASVLSSQTASHLRNAIGLNDRLMLLNDLFENDSAVYEHTMDILDACDNLDDAYIYLYEHFTIDDSKDGVRLLIALLESKFS